MTRKPEDLRTALDTALSGVACDPALYNHIINISRGEAPPVKRKLTLSIAVVFLLILLAGSAAIAGAWRGVSYFLVERYNTTEKLDKNYLLRDIQQEHSNPVAHVTLVDAYWDGVDLNVSLRVSPVDPAQVIRLECNYPAHDHYRPMEEATLLLHPTDGYNIQIATSENVILEHPHHWSSDFVYEEDGSVTMFNGFPLNSMTDTMSISIPVSLTLLSTGEQFDSVLQCKLSPLDDPIPEHEHVWEPATCTSPKICTICKRYEGEQGEHQFQPSPNFPELSVCSVCKMVRDWDQAIPSHIVFQPGDDHEYVQILQWHLRQRGYQHLGVRGSYDEETMEAVKAFQLDHGLEPDGICDSETLLALFP